MPNVLTNMNVTCGETEAIHLTLISNNLDITLTLSHKYPDIVASEFDMWVKQDFFLPHKLYLIGHTHTHKSPTQKRRKKKREEECREKKSLRFP